MIAEEDIKQRLLSKFALPEEAVRVTRRRRIFLDVNQDIFQEAFDYAVKELKFPILLTITGLDLQDRFGIIYHLAQETGIILNVKTTIPRDNPALKTITPIFANADIYERELTDLLGIKIEGLQPGNRYPLPDGWPENQYPLRKDWNKDCLDTPKKSGGDHDA